ncbi:sensor histidine kinase [uncultured Neglectibacter sp.]|uniref:sensor histidine kinase n=1 Tax=uncultured Neglectibacter sp. TaxID=1924108 RepID=UPI0034DEF253
MATKSKNTSVFKGLVSWVCLMAMLCGIATGALLLVIVAVNPDWQGRIADFFASLSAASYEGVELGSSTTLSQQREQLVYGFTVQLISILALCVAVLVPVFAFRQDRRYVEAAIARGLSKIWIEAKLIFLFLVLFSCLALGSGTGMISSILSLCVVVILLYFLCLDVGHNKHIFRHNIIHSILKALNSYREMSTFQQRSLRRLYSCLGVIAGVLALSGLAFFFLNETLPWGHYIRDTLLLGTIVFAAVGVVGTILWYVFALKQDLRDWNILMAQIAEMYGGNLDAVNHVPPASNLYDCAMQLNMIRIGIQKAVEEGIKADRTKVELITNVSHDIKTPLTSIISYIELIKKEPDLPPLVMDYVATISRKADRLSAIVQDVFEVSKAATGNISLDLEDLDIGKLLKQTFGEMEELLRASPLVWRVDIPDTPLMVHADGQRLYRVFQNLLRNCTQYSLEGSRVYLQLTAQNGKAVVTIRNISKNEITMNGEDLTARFVRGDQNRTTEGSGLGLSIAKSFTEACGGQFTVHTDGDVFTTVVQFPLVAEPTPQPVQEVQPVQAPAPAQPQQAFPQPELPSQEGVPPQG